MIKSKRKILRSGMKKAGKPLTNFVAFMLFYGIFVSQVLAENTSAETEDLTGFTLEMITVTAKVPDWWGTEASQSVSVITREDIEKKQAKSVEDIIFSETGMSRNVDAMGRVTVSIRGAEPRHTLILIDGHPVMGDFAKYSGQGDELQRLGIENVERIEIIRGASSARYGTDAIGGVVNVITRKPAQSAGMQANLEGRRIKGDGDLLPYPNFFLRADSGRMGKLRASVYGGKREVMPVYSKALFHGGINTTAAIRNSLRHYGDIKNIGVLATYDMDDKNKIDVGIDRTNEEMNRFVKHSDDTPDPVINYRRHVNRNTYRVSYTGNNGGSTDWQVDMDYARMREHDITLSSVAAYSQYEGKNTLGYLDHILHSQWDIRANANTRLNDKHFLTYGVGFSKEDGEGSRLKSAKNTKTRYIDPWDYDKNLHSDKGISEPRSNIYDYAMYLDEKGIPQYDQAYELYGYKNADGKSVVPAYTYQDYTDSVDDENRIAAFAQQLRDENPSLQIADEWGEFPDDDIVMRRYYDAKILKWHGKTFLEEAENRRNRQAIGRAEINKQHFFVQDKWQIRKDTLLTPILRLDHSNLFGSNMSFNMGITHTIGESDKQRFKANIGTGYAEPGMGELYYNWEMYAGMPYDLGIGKLGAYWFGNPNLKPEKSLNFDLGFETERGRTATRVNVFHNRIKDYMTTYFTGKLMNFYPDAGVHTWITPPDMIYSFKNIGKAEITGMEAEVSHRFDDNWSGKMGYTYLHAVNKSDPDMPRQLLNKPRHKIDIGITYDNKKAGWRASLWGDYYIHMLDSNTIANNGNYVHNDIGDGQPVYKFAEKGKQTYQQKTFGIWNFLIQKKLNKDSIVYAGIDNLFNHRDDDQAVQERVYKFGVNMKFGTVAQGVDGKDADLKETPVSGEPWFIKAPFDLNKPEGVALIGGYRMRWNTFEGKQKPAEARVTSESSIGSAYKNYLEKAEHGFEQYFRLGLDARIGKYTNVTILGSASSASGVDTMQDVAGSKGLNHQRLEVAELMQHANKWDFSLGRLTEPMGVTGYWFGKEYDGGRAVWTSGKNQVRLGYGSFSSSTGINDSAYTHATTQVFMRPPTKHEWLGQDQPENYALHGEYSDMTVQTPGFESLYQKLVKAGSLEEEKKVIDAYMAIIKKDNPSLYEDLSKHSGQYYMNSYIWRKVTVKDDAGNVVKEFITTDVPVVYVKDTSFDKEKIQQTGEEAWQHIMALTGEHVEEWDDYIQDSALIHEGSYHITSAFYGYGAYTGKEVLEDLGAVHKGKRYAGFPANKMKAGEIKFLMPAEAKNRAVSSLWNRDTAWLPVYKKLPNGNGLQGYKAASISPIAKRVLFWLAGDMWKPEDGSTLPLHLLGKEGYWISQLGRVLVQDRVPSIDTTAFIQAKHQFGDMFGVQAWYLRSMPGDVHNFVHAKGNSNEVKTFDRLANVIGIGARYRFGRNASLAFDYGQNRTNFGRYMNGHTIYQHESGTSNFGILGRKSGGTPHFWTVRFDLGNSDMGIPGSWNAFVDYKYFQHGSFFGGNGTESVPDRYLDGIRSFTIGVGYVPTKNLLLEAFYTFDAKGISKRDTLYGNEKFTLGDYTRVQATYRF